MAFTCLFISVVAVRSYLIFDSQVHTAASECLLQMSRLYRSIPSAQRQKVEFREELVHLHEVEKSEQAKTLLGKVIAILDELREENAQLMM